MTQSIRRSRPLGWLLLGLGVLLAVAMVVHHLQQRTKPRQVFFGLDVPSSSTQVAAVADKLGVSPTVSSIFVKLDTPAVKDMVLAMGSTVTPFVTVEPWSNASTWGDANLPQYSLASIYGGAHDVDLRRIAHQLAATHRALYLRFAHEMNGYWYPWAEGVNGNTAGEYVRAWRHAHDIMQPILGSLVQWVWSPNIVSGVHAGAPTLSELYPGDAYVDIAGMTGYSHGASLTSTFCQTVTGIEAVSKRPIVLSEIGVDSKDKDAWLSGLGGFLGANSRIVGFVYYNTSGDTTGASGYYRIDQRASYTAALRSSVAQLPDPQPSSDQRCR